MSIDINTSYTTSRPDVQARPKPAVAKKRELQQGNAQGVFTAAFPEIKGQGASAGTAEATNAPISEDERTYFQQLFPTAAEELRTYSPYQKNGMPSAGQLGRLIDAKG